ncbi:hypothetical protein [Desulforamulus aquiferis]|uniref:Uncharacterized protein n=1 Tax=Desulforamulus aquiferis TaxID=1397668 RepID=A0AAW7Z9B5_9FIRM|nr:hypothetical protein [Desulforamulus aquiferis]MDO7786338.1 hypothetical protein [Desulforamulus aquiferis]RYD06631.1 hypothetical protein N752_02880 [Desulforamulus aquiferis]
MIENRFRRLVEVTAPRGENTGITFSDQQIKAVKSGYLSSYDEVLDLLDEYDITVQKGKYKWKNR